MAAFYHARKPRAGCQERCGHRVAAKTTLPSLCLSKQGLMTHGVSRDLSVACRIKAGALSVAQAPSPNKTQHPLVISPLLINRNFCDILPAFPSVSWIYGLFNWHQTLAPVLFRLEMVTSWDPGEECVCGGAVDGPHRAQAASHETALGTSSVSEALARHTPYPGCSAWIYFSKPQENWEMGGREQARANQVAPPHEGLGTFSLRAIPFIIPPPPPTAPWLVEVRNGVSSIWFFLSKEHMLTTWWISSPHLEHE